MESRSTNEVRGVNNTQSANKPKGGKVLGQGKGGKGKQEQSVNQRQEQKQTTKLPRSNQFKAAPTAFKNYLDNPYNYEWWVFSILRFSDLLGILCRQNRLSRSVLSWDASILRNAIGRTRRKSAPTRTTEVTRSA